MKSLHEIKSIVKRILLFKKIPINKRIYIERESIDHPITRLTLSHKSLDQFRRSSEKVVQKSRLSRGKLKMQPAVWLWRNGPAALDIWTYSILIAFQKNGRWIKVPIKRPRHDRPHLISWFYLRFTPDGF